MDTLDSKNTRKGRRSHRESQLLAPYGILFHAIGDALRLMESGKTAAAIPVLKEAQLRAIDTFLWQNAQTPMPVLPRTAEPDRSQE